MRKCKVDRFDFTEEDNPSLWPMRINDGGTEYGYCPGKATWDNDAVNQFRLMSVCVELKQLPYVGGMLDQPDWVVELLSWFAPRYDSAKFSSRARQVLGDGNNGNNHRPVNGKDSR